MYRHFITADSACQHPACVFVGMMRNDNVVAAPSFSPPLPVTATPGKCYAAYKIVGAGSPARPTLPQTRPRQRRLSTIHSHRVRTNKAGDQWSPLQVLCNLYGVGASNARPPHNTVNLNIAPHTGLFIPLLPQPRQTGAFGKAAGAQLYRVVPQAPRTQPKRLFVRLTLIRVLSQLPHTSPYYHTHKSRCGVRMHLHHRQ